jgi:small-conductance mechanosensitive channel
MKDTHPFLTVLRVVAILVFIKALFHLMRDWEWIPNEGGWGTERIAVLMFWAVVAYVVDLVMRRFIANWKLLNVLQVIVVTLTVSAMLWLA